MIDRPNRHSAKENGLLSRQFSFDANLLATETVCGLNLRTDGVPILHRIAVPRHTALVGIDLPDRVFQKLFMESVDDAFSSLGDSARQAIYFHLETKFKISRKDIPNRLDEFENGLEKIFGAGTRYLEILIMRKLYENMEPKKKVVKWDESKEFRFSDYVRAAASTFSKCSKKT
jgi:hypothetical protein